MNIGIQVLTENFARGHITIAELEKMLEAPLLREAGPQQAVPDGWEPLPPCDHNWFEMTAYGDSRRVYLCSGCSQRRWEPW